MRLAAILAATALACVGCGGDIELEIDPAFPPESASAIRAAAGSWNVWTGSGGRKFIEATPKHGDVLVLSAHNALGGGLEQGRFNIVRIDPDVPPWDVEVTTAHELGHVLGLRHTSTGFMASPIRKYEFTDEVRKECERAGACD